MLPRPPSSHVQDLLRRDGRRRRPAGNPARPSEPAAEPGNVTAFRRPPAKPKATASGPHPKPRLPVALIFICLAVVYVGIRFYWQWGGNIRFASPFWGTAPRPGNFDASGISLPRRLVATARRQAQCRA